jgi:hypothetical protein
MPGSQVPPARRSNIQRHRITPEELAEFMASLEEDEIAAEAANSTDYDPE